MGLWVIYFSASVLLNFFNEHIHLWSEKQTEPVKLQADEFLFVAEGNGEELLSLDWKNVMNKQYLIIH